VADVNLDGGGVDMHTKPTEAAMDRLDRITAQFRSNWTVDRTAMGALEGQLGKGPLGRAFAAQYNPAADELSQNAELIARKVERQARIGRACVLIYLAADAEGRQAFGG
jgi:hypothetical protein